MNDYLPLWPAGETPGALGVEDPDTPAIQVYSPAGGGCGTAVVICPGGGYGGLADHEGRPVAQWLNTLGVTGVVLRYRLGPRYRHPVMWNDVSRAVRTTRSRSDDWKIAADRIGVLGFSAGGHLAATVSCHFDGGMPNAADPVERASSRPDFSVLIYPVISLVGASAHSGSRHNLLGHDADLALVARLSLETQVSPDTPPTFLVHSTDDSAVPVENSLRYALALEAAGVPFAMQVYDRGQHGFGLGREGDPVTSSWPDQCARWLGANGFFSAAV